MSNTFSRKITIRGLLIVLAFILSWVELQLPGFFPIPGIKLGLSNLVVLFALYRLGNKDALAINLVRILLTGFTFGNTFAMLYSLAGGLLSYLVMYLLKEKTSFSLRFVSMSGGIAHNAGQILAAMVLLKSLSILWYLPILWISGIAAGILVGLLCELIIKRIPVDV